MDNEDELDDLLARNKYSFSNQLARLKETLNLIRPRNGNFLFPDIVGRIVWNACATGKAIAILSEEDYDYGVKSVARKLFEAYITLEHLFSAQSREKEIARIMAYEFFEADETKRNMDKAEKAAAKVVAGFNENKEIIEHFKSAIRGKKHHWHWSEKSFAKIISTSLEKTGNKELDDMIYQTKMSFLKTLHKGAHITLNLQEDLLVETHSKELVYSDPFKNSKSKLLGYLGISRITMKDIIGLIEANKKSLC